MLVLTFSLTACNSVDTSPSKNDTSDNTKPTLIFDKKNVKISFKEIAPDIGVGEGISLLIENSRPESIIVNISEVFIDDTMQKVIQPQMPFNVTSPEKNSIQTFVFPNTKIDGNTIQFKARILDEHYKEIFVSDFLKISLS